MASLYFRLFFFKVFFLQVLGFTFSLTFSQHRPNTLTVSTHNTAKTAWVTFLHLHWFLAHTLNYCFTVKQMWHSWPKPNTNWGFFSSSTFFSSSYYEGNAIALNTLLIHRYTWEYLRTSPDGGPSNLKSKGIIKRQKN